MYGGFCEVAKKSGRNNVVAVFLQNLMQKSATTTVEY